ncbi:MAG: VOC family protein [Acetobacteraceae bacterium]
MFTGAGRFVWYELLTSDPQAAATFYRDVVGWRAQDSRMTDVSYTLFLAEQTMVAGLMAIPGEMRAMGLYPCWIGYVGVDDVDAGIARVQRAGGWVRRAARNIPGVGRFAVMADLHGAVFCLFSSASGQPAPPVPPGTPGYFGWHELQAGDLDSDFSFYESLFGWTKAGTLDLGPMGIYQMFAIGGRPCGGMMTKMPEALQAFWLYYINVDAIDAAAARVRAGGGQVAYGPQQMPDGSWIMQCEDPQGAMFSIMSRQR